MKQRTLFTPDNPDTSLILKRKHKRSITNPERSRVVDLPFDINKVHLMDCISGMKLLPDQSIDIAIADPPYNASKGGIWKWDNSINLPGFGGNWSKIMESWDTMGLSDYINFTASWLFELKRVVKPTGSLWIHGTYHNIGIVNFFLQKMGIEIINEVIWYKRNSFPNLAGRRLTASHETILWAHTGRRREYFFDYEASKRTHCPGDLLKVPDKQMRTVWDIPNNKERNELRFGKHPAQKPIRLLSRMIEISAKIGWLCLVPFAGVGSECVAAMRAGLKFLAFETDPKYFEICTNRVSHESSSNIFTVDSPKVLNNPNHKLAPLKPEKLGNRSLVIPSLIKWTGSKRSQAKAIRLLMPDYDRYFEPFLGGGALLYLSARPGSVAGDIYEPLIQLWKLVQDNPLLVFSDYESQWSQLQKDFPGYFYIVRDRFNEKKSPLDLNFLMRTCVNGIARFNNDGAFNNSFHLSRKGMMPLRFKTIVNSWSERLRGVIVVCQDYEQTVAGAKPSDFVYFDPPYAGNKQRYTEDLEINRFYAVLELLNRRGVKWAWSFDGTRADTDLSHSVPTDLYKRRLLLHSGNSAVSKVLNGPIEKVEESLYLNY
jgi:DNA adenine methylase Dam